MISKELRQALIETAIKNEYIENMLIHTPERGKEIFMEFKKAVKTKSWLRLAIDGVSGSGKTFTAAAIGTGMVEAIGGRLAIIDSEHGSASLYADRFDFDFVNLKCFQIEDYIEALDAAAAARYPVIIIDSTSHAWDALVERVERIAGQKYSGNTFRAWGEGTPLQKKLIEAMLNYPGHVIVTCRSKTEYSVDKDEKGKTTVRKVGTAAVQRQGFEYEFTMSMTMDANHVGLVTKDRTSKFQDKFIEKPGRELGRQLIAWLNEGADPPPAAKTREQMETEYLAVKTELKNIMQSRGPDGSALFTGAEYNAVAAVFAGLKGKPVQEYLAAAEALLAEKKSQMRDRYGALTAPAVPAPGPAATPPPLPEMYSQAEDDGFEDDIPEGFTKAGEETPAKAELDIF
jgi:hypothetical protein